MSTDGKITPIQRQRSPSFPFIPLAKAIDRAREFEAQYGRHKAKQDLAMSKWGYKPGSSGGQQTIGALIAFGLLDDEGRAESRQLFMSELGKTILKDTRPGKREEALKIAALKPALIKRYWEKWGADPPPKGDRKAELHLEQGFNEEAAVRFVNVYDKSIELAGLKVGDAPLTDEPRVGEEIEEKNVNDLPPPPPPPPPGLTTRSVQLPLSATTWATLTAPFPMTEQLWNQMLAILGAMKPALVEDKTTEQQ